MVDIAAQAKAGLLFVTPVSNLRDFAPFKSENQPGLSRERLQAWRVAYDKGRAFLKNNQFEDAIQSFNQALAIDDRHADLLFRKGHALLALGNDGDAREFLVRARNEDICPLRALSASLDIMRRVAHQRGTPLLDWEPIASSRSEHHIPGGDILADHVHLKMLASKMLALDLLDWMAGKKIVEPSPDWGRPAVDEVTRQVEAGIDRARYALELYNLSRLLDILGQPEQSLKRVQEAMELNGENLEGLCLAANYHQKLGHIQSANELFLRALALQPGAASAEEGLGALLLSQGQARGALEHLLAARRAAPDSASVLNRLGAAYVQLGRFDEAIPPLRRASQLSPKEAPIHSSLALAHERRGNRREAIDHYLEALRLNPQYTEARSGLHRVTSANELTKGR
jgi:tetratricopeptide (TPR) repeat protein